MWLHLPDLYPHPTCLFFREKLYPWESPQADFADAKKVIIGQELM